MLAAVVATRMRGLGRELLLAIPIGLFLGLVGPFGNFLQAPVWVRAPYWIGMVLAGVLVYSPAARLALPPGLPLGQVLLRGAPLVAVLSVPLAGLVSIVATRLWPSLSSFSLLDWYLQVLAISTPLVAGQVALNRAMAGRRRSAEAAVQPGDLGARPEEILCLQMEDHYVRVHTRRGSHLVLATMSQAIATAGPGLRVHRSWWVAAGAVEAAQMQGRNLRLRLVNGLTAPVARASVAAVRAAGWLSTDSAAA